MAEASAPAADRFIAALASGQDWPAPLAIVVAHPDDETIGIGGHLGQLRSLSIIHVTQGAPSDLVDARANGFATVEGYAAQRRAELKEALQVAGIAPRSMTMLGVIDQTAYRCLPTLSRCLAELFAANGAGLVLTHAYEGGHPDHDACAFAVHAASALLARRGHPAPALVEMALYHDDGAGLAAQSFVPDPAGEGSRLPLDDAAWQRKQRMIDCFVTQKALAPFRRRIERVRPAPHYDFSRLPNRGQLYYERFRWGASGAAWLAALASALGELELPAVL